MSLTRLFSDVDDFCLWFTPEWEKAQIENGEEKGTALTRYLIERL